MRKHNSIYNNGKIDLEWNKTNISSRFVSRLKQSVAAVNTPTTSSSSAVLSKSAAAATPTVKVPPPTKKKAAPAPPPPQEESSDGEECYSDDVDSDLE